MSTARGIRSSASRYSGKDSQSHWMPSASALPGMSSTPSMSSISHSCPSGRAGAKPMPQLPTTAVVTPCQHDGVRCGSQVAWPSKWVCTSTKPGVTSSPSASRTRRALLADPAHLDDAAVRHRDVGLHRRAAGAVDDGATPDQQVQHALTPR